jgi:hypothetical protein
MAFDLALLKEHPYATGGIVIVGGVAVFYLLSSRSSAAPAQASAAVPDNSAVLAYSSQLAQAQAAAEVQTNAQQVQLQQTQLQADVASQQIDASLHTNDVNTAAQLAATLAQIQAGAESTTQTLAAQTTQQANQLVYAQNIQQMQDAVLESQINSGVVENANNNATALAGTEATLNYQQTIAGMQATLASQGLTEASDLAEKQQSDFETNVQAILPNAGKAYNSALDANNALALQQTILTGGNPAVAAAGIQSSSTATVSGNQTGIATINAIINGLIGTARTPTTGTVAGLFP